MVPTARILADRRLLVSTLALLAVVNLVGLAFVFGPLRSRVQSLTQRATTAGASASTAARELATARQTAAGSQKAMSDLQRFYAEVLPASQPAARQVTFVRLAQIARASNLSFDHRSFAQEDPPKDGVLVRATLSMTVFGSYRDLRRFIYTLETGNEFVVISQLGVSQQDDSDLLEAALTLSTFYRASDGR